MTGVYAARGDEPIFVEEQVSDVLILKLIANPARSNYRSKQFEYNRLMRKIGEPDVEHLLFDFADCLNIDSVTVGIVTAMTLHLRQNGGQTVAMCNCDPELRQTITRLVNLEPSNRRTTWPHFPNRRHAMQALCSDSN